MRAGLILVDPIRIIRDEMGNFQLFPWDYHSSRTLYRTFFKDQP